MNAKTKQELIRHTFRSGRRDAVVQLRISKTEKAEVCSVAAEAGLGVSSYLLSLHRMFMETVEK